MSSNAMERSNDIGWFLDHPESRIHIRAASAYDQERTPGATVTLIERLNVVPSQYRYARLVVEPDFAGRVLEAGEACIGECHWRPNGRCAVHVVLGGKKHTLN
jgi:hypothetical protein